WPWSYKSRPLLRHGGKKVSGSSLDTCTALWCKVKLTNSGGQNKQMFSRLSVKRWGNDFMGLWLRCFHLNVIHRKSSGSGII
ncbi:mCG144887, partial [Mus musculus]